MSAGLTPTLEAGVFTGYASLFGETDLGGDVVAPGAFRASLRTRGARGVRMLFQHDPAQPIGRWLDIAEDAKGLRVVGKLNLDVARARELAALIRDGALDGLSIGYKTIRAARAPGGARKLLALDLWEISLVTFPMLPGARVGVKLHSAKSVPDILKSRSDWLACASALNRILQTTQPPFEARYRSDQPRDERGKWTYDGGRRRRPSSGTVDRTGPAVLLAAGGFTPDQMDMSVQAFMSAFARAVSKK
jgi:HK97 family phage prohead protease